MPDLVFPTLDPQTADTERLLLAKLAAANAASYRPDASIGQKLTLLPQALRTTTVSSPSFRSYGARGIMIEYFNSVAGAAVDLELWLQPWVTTGGGLFYIIKPLTLTNVRRRLILYPGITPVNFNPTPGPGESNSWGAFNAVMGYEFNVAVIHNTATPTTYGITAVLLP